MLVFFSTIQRAGEFNSYPIPDYRWLVPDAGWARISTLGFMNGNVWATGMTIGPDTEIGPRD